MAPESATRPCAPPDAARQSGLGDVPWLGGVFPSPRHDHATPRARAAGGVRPLPPGLCDTVWSFGRWRDGELRVAACPDGAVLTVGPCLADDRALRRGLEDALRTGDWTLLTRWPGSYLGVLVRPDELVLFTDLAGQFPLYYADPDNGGAGGESDAGGTAFATRPAAAATLAGLPVRPDPAFLAAQLTCPGAWPLTAGRSPLRGVSRLEGGQVLRLGGRQRASPRTYEELTVCPDGSADDAAQTLRHALDAAVRARVSAGGRLSADFSGGMDSTSLAFLAAGHTGGPLPVFTYHHPEVPAGDLEHARAFARLDGRLALTEVAGTADTLPFAATAPCAVTLPCAASLPFAATAPCQVLGGTVPGDEPDPGAPAAARLHARLRAVADGGGQVHLGGEGGDALLGAPPSYLGDLVRTGQTRRMLREARLLARSQYCAPAAVAARAVRLSRTPLSAALRELAREFTRPVPRQTAWGDLVAWWPRPAAEACWVTSAARVELADRAARLAASPGLEPGGGGRTGVGVADRVLLAELHASAAVHGRVSDAGRAHGVWPQAPFLDNSVVRAATAVPVHRRAAAGTVKPVLVRALRGLVPEPVLARRDKGDYSAEDYRGLRAYADGVTALLADSRLAALGVLDPGPVRVVVERARMGVAVPFPALNRLVGAEVWLRALEAQPGAVTPA